MTVATDMADTPAAAPAMSARTRLLLEGPVLRTLVRLSAPNFGEAAARIAFIAFDAIFVGWIGTDALAGVSLAFPIFLLMQTMSASGLGSGVAAAIGQALGAGRRAEAEAVAAHAVWLALIVAALFTTLMLAGGPWIYGALGAEGASLDAALTYSGIVFGGIVAVWTMNLLANVVRGSGVMTVPAAAIVIGEVAHLALSPTLILGLGPFPELGVVGAGIAILSAYVVGALVLIVYLVRGRGVIGFRRAAFRFRPAVLGAVLKVGLLASLNTIQIQATFLGLTGLFASFGAASLAGFGAANRLELLQIPITFAVGSAVITMIATNTGAGRHDRVRRIAWTGGALSVAIGMVFGAVALFLPRAWMGLFGTDPVMIEAGAVYLTAMGPLLPLLGFGFAVFFALLGTGSTLFPFLAGTARLAVAVGGGWWVLEHMQGQAGDLAVTAALASLVLFAGTVLAGWRLLFGGR
ncbi:MAG: MATE family efflux transporter [Pseudomonadota bacterium]|nr:MATE family efflux transporter [Pseudomonadota bacterium]